MWTHLEQTLEQYRNLIDTELQGKLEGTDIGNQSTVILESGDSIYEISFKTLDYFKYIENGRKPGSKMPPVSAISQWITKKQILPRMVSKSSPTLPQLSFVIARSIGEKGIPGKNYLEDVKKTLLGDQINQAIQNALTQDLDDELNRL